MFYRMLNYDPVFFDNGVLFDLIPHVLVTS